jgi:integrase
MRRKPVSIVCCQMGRNGTAGEHRHESWLTSQRVANWIAHQSLVTRTGQRIGDVLEMRWSDIQDGGFAIRQNKTSKELWIPILPELQTALDAASRHSVFLLTNERGTNRWSYRGASQAVRLVRDRINALDYDIHSWRYNAACELVEAGCGDDLVASVTGQSPAMVQHYTKRVRQKIRATQAQQKRTEQKQNV